MEACREKGVSEAKTNPGMILRQLCKSFLKGICTRSPCEYWHPPECQFYKTDSGCKAGEKCLFPHHKVEEQPNKKPKQSYHSHKGRESEEKSAVAIVKTVPQLGCVSQYSESLESQRGAGKPDEKSFGTISKRTVHSVHATSSKYPRKERTIAWISKLPTL